jgi:hypothetical protein
MLQSDRVSTASRIIETLSDVSVERDRVPKISVLGHLTVSE